MNDYKREFSLCKQILHSKGVKVKRYFQFFLEALSLTETEGLVFFWINEHRGVEVFSHSTIARDLGIADESAVYDATTKLELQGLIEEVHLPDYVIALDVTDKTMTFALVTYVNYRQRMDGCSKSTASDADSIIIDTLMRHISCSPSAYCSLFHDALEKAPDGRFATFLRENDFQSLSEDVQGLFWSLCRNYLLHFTEPFDGDVSRNDADILVRKGWVEVFSTCTGSSIDTENYCLSPEVAARLFGGREEIIKYSDLSSAGALKLCKDIPEKPLFFGKETAAQASKLERMADEKEYSRIRRSLDEKNLRMSLSAILYGPPGTGKTELAMQIARKSGRNLLMVDASKLYGSLWGESEVRFRNLFRVFRHVEAVAKRAPILFIDECDAILSRRFSSPRLSIELSENTVRNIILDELGRFRGILLVATNNISGLDPAMDRRFLLKVEIGLPDEAMRTCIWKSKMPGLSDSVAAVLAHRFAFSGGHIDNVVTLAGIDELLDGVTPDLALLSKYCLMEQEYTDKSNNAIKVGF